MLVIPKSFDTFMQAHCPKNPTLVVGVSGGADSLYLTLLLDKWIQKKGGNLYAVTVNHNLRPEAAEEALTVHKLMSKLKISHTILTWEGPKPTSRIEEKAREKRYELILKFAHEKHAQAICLAHHRQDQVETFWARLARSSGLDGLTAMAPASKREDIIVLRPLLDIDKKNITQTLKQNKIKWIEDPMNKDTAYERVRWRQRQKDLDGISLTAPVVAKSISRLQRAKEALDFYTQGFIDKCVTKSSFGFIQFDETTFLSNPTEIRIRIIHHLLQNISPKKQIISLESIEQIATTMPRHATLAGCQWVCSHHQIFIALELKNVPSNVLIPENQWTKWGTLKIWTNKSFVAEPCAPKPRIKGIPYLIQRTFLKIPASHFIKKMPICFEKDLEKKLILDYKNKAPVIVIATEERGQNEKNKI